MKNNFTKIAFTKRTLTYFLTAVTFVLISQNIHAATVTAIAVGGNWNNNATWDTGAKPVAGDDVIIPSAAPVTISGTNSFTCKTLTIQGTGSVSVGATAFLIITDAVDFSATGTITGSGSLTFNSMATLTTANAGGLNSSIANTGTRPLSLPTDGTYVFNGAVAQNTGAVLPATVGNLTINNTSGAAPAVTLNNTGGVAVTGTLALTSGVFRVGGDRIITIGSTTTISLGTGLLDLASGTSTKIVFNNTTNYSLPATLFSGNPKNVEINGGGLTLNANLVIGTTLTLTSGNITIGDFDLTINGSISGGSSSSFVATNGTGLLSLPIPAAVSTTLYPIGRGSKYRPTTVEFTVAPTAGTLKTRFSNSNPGTTGLPIMEGGATINGVSPNGFWRYTSSIADGVYTVSVDASGFTKTDGVTPITDLTDVRLIKRPTGSPWTATTTTTMSDPSSLSSLSSAGLTGFSDFALGVSSIVLPIELTKFEANSKSKSTLLTWTTASEKDNALFNIEHSNDGKAFSKIGEVKGSGTTYTATDYSFEHTTPSVGINYYRLQQVDFDGKTEYSPMRSVLNSGKGFKVKTTLVQDALIVVADSDSPVSVDVFNTVGQQVLSKTIQGEQIIDVSALQNGLYFIRSASGEIGRFVKN